MSELDNPVWEALVGRQRDLGTATPLAALFRPDVSPFGGFPVAPTEAHWQDMAGLVGAGGTMAVTGATGDPPSGWRLVRRAAGCPDGLRSARPALRLRAGRPPTDVPVPLGEVDVPDMLALVAAARPGPFLPRTVEFGGYVGVRRPGPARGHGRRAPAASGVRRDQRGGHRSRPPAPGPRRAPGPGRGARIRRAGERSPSCTPP